MTDSPEPVDGDLIDAAARLITAITDRENHTVSAAIRTTTGEIVTGVNLYHFSGGPCAEVVALANLAASRQAPQTIVAVAGERGILAPCGRCRQVMIDYWPGIRVILPDRRTVPIADLLPSAFLRS